MKLCFLTKYPPIQGGVSTQCYWAARGLAERGHFVRVITNADEVEDMFRIDLAPEDRAGNGPYAMRFPATGGQVVVDSTERPDRRTLYYIPQGNPTTSRLVSRALEAIARDGCDAIFAQYLEPYGVAASIVGGWTATPYVFKHAGSDLFRLMEVPDLAPCYAEVLRRAHRVITGGRAQRVVRGHGVGDAQIVTGIGFGLPRSAFHPAAPPADLNRMLARAAERWAGSDDLAPLVAPLEPGLPVLGLYGKLGEQKGTFDLLRAMRSLVDEGFPFHLMVLGRGWQEGTFAQKIVELALARYVRMHPFVPHWRVPGFLRACDAVAFLERDFAIAAHTPGIPSEVLSCGCCLVVSEEVLRKQMFRGRARHRQNLVVVSDPRDAGELARALRFALSDPERAHRIGAAGYALTDEMPDVATYVEGLERVLRAVVGEPPPPRPRPNREANAEDRFDPLPVVQRLYPYTTALLGTEAEQVARAALAGSGIGDGAMAPRAFAVAVGSQLQVKLELLEDGPAMDMCRYERLVHAWTGEREEEQKHPDSHLAFDPEGPDARAQEFGLRGESAVELFSYDVEELAQHIARGEEIPPCGHARFRLAGGLHVLFHRGSFPQRVSRGTAALLAILGERVLSFADLRGELAHALGVRSAEIAEDDLRGIVEGLFWEGIIRTGPAEKTIEQPEQVS